MGYIIELVSPLSRLFSGLLKYSEPFTSVTLQLGQSSVRARASQFLLISLNTLALLRNL